MGTQQNTNTKLEEEDKERKFKEQVKDSKEVEAAAKVPITSPASPSSSPSHEFSFTVSLHSSSTPALNNNNNNSNNSNNNKAKALPPPPFAIDLSPADDIFFHGHLLPLHLLSHLPVSPRSSTNSMDSFTLPIRELLDDQKQKPNKNTINNCSTGHGNRSSNITGDYDQSKSRSKPKYFSLFRWRKGCEVRDREDKVKQKKKLRFEVSHVLKRYLRMIRPLLFFKGRRENLQFHRQPCSFSGNLSTRNRQELRGRRGEFSAPASMRTSPTNSGLLVATATLPSSASDSTMEELQAAIQAAIAHCKNSIAAEDKKIKC